MRSLESHVREDSVYYNYSPSAIARDYLLYPICVGDFVYAPGYDLRRTTFSSFLLEIILEGCVTIETGGRTFRAQAGQVVLIDCHQPHRYFSDQGWHALWVHFDGSSARGYVELITRQHGSVMTPAQPWQIHSTLNELFSLFHHAGALSETQLALLLTQALTALAEPPAAPDSAALPLENIMAHINATLKEPPTVAALAKEANLSEYHFIRVFREKVGMPPRQYIIAARMEHARYLLKATTLPIGEIADQVGYQSVSMFSAMFKRQHGLSPRDYRAECCTPKH